VFGHASLESLELWTRNASVEDLAGSHVVWLIGKITPYTAEKNSQLVELEINILESYLRNPNFVNLPLTLISSGGCVYSSKTNLAAKESDVAEGNNAYGRAKVQLEKRFLDSRVSGNILRLGNVYGESALPRHGQGVLAHWIDNYNKGLPLKVFGPVDQSRDYIYITDVCAAIEASFILPQDSSIYNVGTGRGVTLSELLSVFEKVSGKPFSVDFMPGRPEDNFSYSLDISKFTFKTDWIPTVSIEKGLWFMFSSAGIGNINASD
jgi:UDP-glucose 4-epimerase